MKNLIFKLFVLALTIATFTVPSSAIVHTGEEPNTDITFSRPMAMGNAFTAVADDANVFAYNPAGMVMRTGGEFTLLELMVGAAEDSKEAYDFLKDNETDLKNWENLTPQRQAQLVTEIAANISALNPRIIASAALASYVSGPTFLGLPFHLGYGAFAATDFQFQLNNAIAIPNISYFINNDIVLPLGIAKRFDAPWFIPGQWGFGGNAKFIRRDQVKQDRQSILELDDFTSPPVATGNGIGADLGFLYQPTERQNWGLMVQDFGGTKISYDSVSGENGYQALPSRDTVIRPRTNIGWAGTPRKILWLLPTHDRWKFAADIRDIFDSEHHLFFSNGVDKPIGDDFWTHTHLGTEFLWGILALRGGFNQGYPTFGAGLDFPVFKFDYTFFSREIGARAGDQRQSHNTISLAVKFGTRGVESREKIIENREMRKGSNDEGSEPMVEETTPEPTSEPTPESTTEAAPESAPAETGGGEEIPQ